MNKKTLRLMRADILDVLKMHPGLKIKTLDDIPVEIFGLYQVKDDDGILQGEFDIRVIIPARYPYGFPHLIESSKKIERIIDRHISEEGITCEEINHKEKIIASKGISLKQYFIKYVHRYFCWQLIYEEEGNKNLNEWSHNEAGIKEFYSDYLKTTDKEIILACLRGLAFNRGLGRNDFCPCGSKKKFKNCHIEVFADLKVLGKAQLLKDLDLLKTDT